MLLMWLVLGACRPSATAGPSLVVIEGALVFTGDGSEPLTDHSLWIRDGRIHHLGPTASREPPPGAQVVDARGHSVLPGIVGMHHHLHMPGAPWLGETLPRAALACGVTTMQTAGAADAEREIALAAAIEAGDVPGPRIVPSAPYISGPGGNAVMLAPSSPDEARAFVAKWDERGAAWFKLYRHVEPSIARAVIEEAHARGRKVTGHLCSLSYTEAARMGIDRLEHGLNPATDFVTDRPAGACVPSRASKAALTLDDPRVAQLIDILVQHEVTLTSTLAILESGFPHRPQADPRSMAALEPGRAQEEQRRQEDLVASASGTTSTPKYWTLLTGFERRFVEAGGRLVAGPDTGRHVILGYGDQRNFELLVEAGFSVPQTVQILSANGAAALGLPDVGQLRVGWQADLFLIEGDPRRDPAVIREVIQVYKAGQRFDPAALLADLQGQVGLR